MKEHDATEQAYKNGYKAGYEAGKKEQNEELKFTRDFIHEHGMEFALLSAWERRKKDGK